MNRQQFEITLESVPSDIPAAARLKRALKVLLRGYGLRCVEAVETHHGKRFATINADDTEGATG